VVLSDGVAQNRAKRAFVAAAKQLSDSKRLEAIRATAAILGVDTPGPPPRSLHLDWNDLKELEHYGFAIGGHTVNHPILSQVSHERAAAEIAESCAEISARLGKSVRSFAYPNGLAGDYDEAHEKATARSNVRLAFSAVGRLATLAAVRNRPLSIPRIGVYRRDDVPRLAAKLAVWPLVAA
jgi:peptidoglycan/xylan/chitin deacetylase (PgdA/CDA1 family)